MPHRGEQLADDDPAAGVDHPRLEAGPDRGRRPGRGSRPVADVLLGGVADLGVHDAVGGQVGDALAGDPLDRRLGLHHRHGVVEGLEVAHQRPESADSANQRPERLRVVGRERVTDLVGQLEDRLRAQAAVEVVVQQDLRAPGGSGRGSPGSGVGQVRPCPDPRRPPRPTDQEQPMRILDDLDELAGLTGQELGTSDWLEIDQDRVNALRRRHRRPPVDPRRRRARGGRPVRRHHRPRLPHPVADPVPRQPGLLARDARRQAQLRRQQGPLPAPGAGRLAGSATTSRSARSPTCPPASSSPCATPSRSRARTSPPASPRRSCCCSLTCRSRGVESADPVDHQRLRGVRRPVGRRRSRPRATPRARSKRSGSSVSSVNSGSPSVTSSPGRACQTTPAPAWTGVLLARAPGAEPPGGEADRHRVEPGQGARRRRGYDVRLAGRRAAARRGRRPARGSSPARRPSPSRRRACRPGRRRRDRRRRASRGRGRASARPRRRGPPPASTSTDSRDLDGVAGGEAERGGHVGEQRDRVHAGVLPSATIVAASSRACVDGPS